MKVATDALGQYQRVSHSEITTWFKCPHRWLLQYDRGYDTPFRGKALIFGNAFHFAAEIFLKDFMGKSIAHLHQKGGHPQRDEVLKWLWYDPFQGYMASEKEKYYPHEVDKIAAEMNDYWPMLHGLLNYLTERIDVVQGEVEKSMCSRVLRDTGIKGLADFMPVLNIGNKTEIHGWDWKTTARDKKHLPEDHRAQCETYALLSGVRKWAMIYFIKKSSMVRPLYYDVPEVEIRNAARLIHDTINSMRSGYAPPLGRYQGQGFGRCSWCPYWRGDENNKKYLGLEKTCKYGRV